MGYKDWIWLKVHKSPRGPKWIYTMTIAPWWIFGFFAAAGAVQESKIVMFLALVAGTAAYLFDKRKGYVTALHENYLKRRTERLTRLDIVDK